VRDGWQVWVTVLAEERSKGRVTPLVLSNASMNRQISGHAAAARDLALESLAAHVREETMLPDRLPATLGLARSEQLLGHWRLALERVQGLDPDAVARAAMYSWSQGLRQCENWIELGQFARALSTLAEIGDRPNLHFKFAVTALCEVARARRWTGQPVADCLDRANAVLPLGSMADLRLRIQLEGLHVGPAERVLAATEPILSEAQALGLDGIVMSAWSVRAARLCGLAPAQAAAAAERALALAADTDAYGLYKPELWWHAARALSAAGHAERAAACVQQAATWIHARVQQGDVPAEFIDSFLHRNPINRELLAWAGRLGVSAAA